MQAGKLDRSITIQAVADSQDAAGSNVEAVTTFATVWAQKIDVRGSEALEAHKLESTHVAKFRIRYLSGVTTKHRVLYDGDTFNIVDIAEIGRRIGMELLVEVLDG